MRQHSNIFSQFRDNGPFPADRKAHSKRRTYRDLASRKYRKLLYSEFFQPTCHTLTIGLPFLCSSSR